jgi:hypothetical protein
MKRMERYCLGDAMARLSSDAMVYPSYAMGILQELLEERGRYDRLRAQFIKHRTATHKTNPHDCETCRESDRVLAEVDL